MEDLTDRGFSLTFRGEPQPNAARCPDGVCIKWAGKNSKFPLGIKQKLMLVQPGSPFRPCGTIMPIPHGNKAHKRGFDLKG